MVLFTPATRRAFHVCASRASRLQKRKAQQNPLSLAFKMGEDEDDDLRPFDPTEVPELDHLDKRWSKLDQMEQEDIILYLHTKMRGDWKELTIPEKKAIWFVNFGPWGPRGAEKDDPGRLYGQYAKVILLALLGAGGYKAYSVIQGDNSKKEVSDNSSTAVSSNSKEQPKSN